MSATWHINHCDQSRVDAARILVRLGGVDHAIREEDAVKLRDELTAVIDAIRRFRAGLEPAKP